MPETMSGFDWLLSGYYARAVNLSGYAHNTYRFRKEKGRSSVELSSYVIMKNGEVVEPEEIVARLQKLDELEAAAEAKETAMESESVGRKVTIIGKWHSPHEPSNGELIAMRMKTTAEPTITLRDDMNDPRFVVWLTEAELEAELEALLEIVREGEEE